MFELAGLLPHQQDVDSVIDSDGEHEPEGEHIEEFSGICSNFIVAIIAATAIARVAT